MHYGRIFLTYFERILHVSRMYFGRILNVFWTYLPIWIVFWTHFEAFGRILDVVETF